MVKMISYILKSCTLHNLHISFFLTGKFSHNDTRSPRSGCRYSFSTIHYILSTYFEEKKKNSQRNTSLVNSGKSDVFIPTQVF